MWAAWSRISQETTPGKDSLPASTFMGCTLAAPLVLLARRAASLCGRNRNSCAEPEPRLPILQSACLHHFLVPGEEVSFFASLLCSASLPLLKGQQRGQADTHLTLAPGAHPGAAGLDSHSAGGGSSPCRVLSTGSGLSQDRSPSGPASPR